MLAEKFILLMETLKSHASPDRSYPPVVSTSPHVPVKLPAVSNNSFRDPRSGRVCLIGQLGRVLIIPVL